MKLSACTERSPTIAGRPGLRTQAGFSMIELMIALVLGLLLAEGVFVLFSEMNRVSAHQAALSQLQETGRIALQIIGDDLRRSGHLPCGSRMRPRVFADALAQHVTGAPPVAAAPPDWPPGKPYQLDRGLFLGGHFCRNGTCAPEIPQELGIPQTGLAEGRRVPGTDVLALRWLQGGGWTVERRGNQCVDDEPLGALSLRRNPGSTLPATPAPGHVALLASCTAASIFGVVVRGEEVEPLVQGFGAPACIDVDAQTRMFDLDAQLQTVVYSIEMKTRDGTADRGVPVLVRRVDGVANEVAEGVERLDFRYSLTDGGGLAYWLDADEVAKATTDGGASLRCKDADEAAERPCSWADVDAVAVSMLVNTVVDVPADASDAMFDYRYSIDGERMSPPPAAMPVTGLAPGRMLRREFRSVVALRSLRP